LNEQSRVREIEDWNRRHIEEKDSKDTPKKRSPMPIVAPKPKLTPIRESKEALPNFTPQPTPVNKCDNSSVGKSIASNATSKFSPSKGTSQTNPSKRTSQVSPSKMSKSNTKSSPSKSVAKKEPTKKTTPRKSTGEKV
jgi:hypothetical protein